MDLTLMKQLEAGEIAIVIRRAMCFGGKMAQSCPDCNRIATIKEVDITPAGKLSFTLIESVEFELDRPLLVTLAYRNLHFHLEPGSFKLEGQQIQAELPTTAKALEVRPDDRYVLPFRSQILCALHRAEKRGLDGNFEVRLVDISQMGLGIQLLNPENCDLQKNDHVWIKPINHITLEQAIFGRVVYISSRTFKDNNQDFRAGIAIDRPLPQEIFSELQRMCLLKLSA